MFLLKDSDSTYYHWKATKHFSKSWSQPLDGHQGMYYYSQHVYENVG